MSKITVTLTAVSSEVETSESRTRRSFKVELKKGGKVEKVTLAELAKEVHAEHLEGEAYTHPKVVFGILNERLKKYAEEPTTKGAVGRSELVKAVFDEIMNLLKKSHTTKTKRVRR